MTRARKSGRSILPVLRCQYHRKHRLACEVGAAKPCSLNDELGYGFGVRSARGTSQKRCIEPELDVAALRVDELLHVQQLARLPKDTVGGARRQVEFLTSPGGNDNYLLTVVDPGGIYTIGGVSAHEVHRYPY